jgi:uncharacterized protein (TIGR02453 family)
MSNLTVAYFEFFKELSKNNNTIWFHANKPRYEKEVKTPFVALIKDIIEELQKTVDPNLNVESKKTLFRINKDIRFSKDKSPYKLNLAASISNGGSSNKGTPGHYLHLEVGSLTIGGGAYFLEKDNLLKIRDKIAMMPKEFKSLVENKEFVMTFGSVRGDKNKRLDPKYMELVSDIPLIANTHFYWMVEIDPKTALQSDAAIVISSYFKKAQKLIDFLNV